MHLTEHLGIRVRLRLWLRLWLRLRLTVEGALPNRIPGYLIWFCQIVHGDDVADHIKRPILKLAQARILVQILANMGRELFVRAQLRVIHSNSDDGPERTV